MRFQAKRAYMGLSHRSFDEGRVMTLVLRRSSLKSRSSKSVMRAAAGAQSVARRWTAQASKFVQETRVARHFAFETLDELFAFSRAIIGRAAC
jgi:hypothetical protein